jgi:diaminopimelate epimerase
MIPFTKMSGTGNDFIVFDNRNVRWTGRETDFFYAICRRRFSAGADGVILAEKGDRAPVRMRYFNRDGMEAAMCANGARCTAYFALHKGFVRENAFRMEASDGLHEVEVTGPTVRLEMGRPRDFRSGFKFEPGSGLREGGFLNTGVPHLVLFLEGPSALKDLNVEATAPSYRNHRLFPGGTNVNFVQRISDDALEVRTYERGVEGETLSCGTGCVASALIAYASLNMPSPIRVITRGGDLRVEFDGEWKQVHLTGPVRMVYEGSLYPEEGK